MCVLTKEDILNDWNSLGESDAGELSLALESFGVLFAYHSGKIENDRISYDDVRTIFEKYMIPNYISDLRTIFEIQNQKDCYKHLRQKTPSAHP